MAKFICDTCHAVYWRRTAGPRFNTNCSGTLQRQPDPKQESCAVCGQPFTVFAIGQRACPGKCTAARSAAACTCASMACRGATKCQKCSPATLTAARFCEASMKNAEHNEQAALFSWAGLQRTKYPELSLMYAIPNAARRSPRQGAWMKAEGMKAGVPDIHLPVPVQGYCGLWIEMKAGKNKPTAAQSEWMEGLRSVGHKCAVCYSWDDARRVIEDYLAHGGRPWPGGMA